MPERNNADKKQARDDISAVFLHCRSSLAAFVGRFLHAHHDVEDVMQDVYLNAFIAERKNRIEFPKAFLFRTARNTALNELGRKSRHVAEFIEDLAGADNSQASEQASVEDCAADQQRMQAFCDAVAGLPPKCRRAFLLRRVYGLSHKEISQEMNISTKTIEKHVAAGLLKCSRHLRENGHGFESPARGARGLNGRDAGAR